jgi:hypothetical protein
MKRTAAAVFIALITLASACGFAQGFINFANNVQTLVSLDGPHAGPPRPFASYYGLFLGPAGTTDTALFTFSGIYGTNQSAEGRFTGGLGISVPGWAPGATRSFFIAGWTADLGHDWQPGWLNANFKGNGYFGLSAVGTGIAGGFDGTNSIFAFNVFGGSAGLQQGFLLHKVQPSQLTCTLDAANVIVSWPTNVAGFSLQSSSSLGASAIWSASFFTPVIVNGQNIVSNPVSGAQQFFRLSR